jgi:acyl phosphate:glycerol-3-phosphate acyltransferase
LNLKMLGWVLIGYAIGSVPFAFLVARRVGIDVRVSGSGNVGAANVLRTSGATLGLLVMVLDISKGAATVLAASAATGAIGAMAAAGAAAVVGHVYPVWLRFHGGKGVAVAAGVFGVLAPAATLAAILVFVAAVWLTRVVSLGSIAATLMLPPLVWLFGAPLEVLSASVGSGALILFRHRSNLRRLFARSERRIGERIP